MAASKTIGGINVTISATIDKFQKAMTLGMKLTKQFVGGIKSLIFSLKGLTAALTVGAFVKWTHSAAQQLDALGELSDKLGISTEKLGGYQLAAAEAGISNELLERSLTKLASKGITLEEWITNTSKLTTQQQKLAAAVGMFGARGANMVRFLGGGVEGLKEAQRAAESLGLALDRKTVMGVERALDAFGRFKMAVSGIFRSLAAEIAPFIEVLSNKAFDMLATSGAGKGIGSTIAKAIIEMTKFVADGIQKMVGAVLSMVSDFKGFVMNFRLNNVFGSGYKTQKEAQEASLDWANAIQRSKKWNSQAPWSSWIQGAMDDAAKQAAAQAALAPAMAGNSIFGKARGALGGLLGSNNAQNAKQLGESLALGIGKAINSVPGLLNKGYWAGLQFQAANWNKSKMAFSSATTSALDPLSREGNSQRVRSLAQNNMQKLGEKQLDEQRRTRVAVEKIAQNPVMLKPANI